MHSGGQVETSICRRFGCWLPVQLWNGGGTDDARTLQRDYPGRVSKQLGGVCAHSIEGFLSEALGVKLWHAAVLVFRHKLPKFRPYLAGK